MLTEKLVRDGVELSELAKDYVDTDYKMVYKCSLLGTERMYHNGLVGVRTHEKDYVRTLNETSRLLSR